MIAVRIGSWGGMSDKDLTILLSSKDVEDLEFSKLEGELLSEFPYEKLNKKAFLRVDDKSRTTAWGAGCDKKGFYIKNFIYDSLKNRGKYLGARYDTHGNKMYLVNYDMEKEDFRFLIGDLKRFQIIR